jgi:hypothetical protein
MLFRELTEVYSHKDTKPINTFCGQNIELTNVKAGDIYIYIVKFEFKGSEFDCCNLSRLDLLICSLFHSINIFIKIVSTASNKLFTLSSKIRN